MGWAITTEVAMNKMYIKEARIANLGAIKRAEVNFQFDNTGNPKCEIYT